MLLKTISATMLALAFCAGLRADDCCKPCEEKKPKCSPCETVKRCGNPIKNFFVHSVGGTIGKGFGMNGCNTCEKAPAPKSDCGCGK
ncbi:MAG: hypothetical protein WCT04_01600 [Planctomycetota bacterium]